MNGRVVLGAAVGPRASRVIVREFGAMLARLAQDLARSPDEGDRATASEIGGALSQMREVLRWEGSRVGLAVPQVPPAGTAEPVTVAEAASSGVLPLDSGARAELLSIGEVAGQLGVSEGFTRRLCRDSDLPATRGERGEWLVHQSDVDDYLDTRRSG